MCQTIIVTVGRILVILFFKKNTSTYLLKIDA